MVLTKLIRTIIVISFITECWSLLFIQLDINKNSDKPVTDFMNNIEKIATLYEERSNSVVQNELPNDCSQREKSKSQPMRNQNSRLKKCCPNGESLSIMKENQSEQLCDSSKLNFKPSVINAVLYDNCIEDIETEVILPLEIGNPCNTSLLYNDEDDTFFVLQDGSLLVMDKFGNDSYSVEKKYCLDIDNISGTTYAIICITSVEEHLQRSQIITIAVFTLISIPCLLIVSYVHMAVKELRTLHGLTLSLMSLCLGVGYFLHSLAHIFKIDSKFIGYAIQYSILSYCFWFLCLCGNVLLNIWYKIPMNKRTTKLITICNFGGYCFISFLCPLILVILTIQKGLPGMPSYFIQGLTESIRESQRYFIPPISAVLFICFISMVISFFGFQKIKKRSALSKGKYGDIYTNVNAEFDEQKYEEVKKDAKCISFMGIITVITWLLEVVTFYSPGPEGYLMFMEIVNGLQGVFILLIFVVVRRRRTIILRWWHDRGSHNLENMELSAIAK